MKDWRFPFLSLFLFLRFLSFFLSQAGIVSNIPLSFRRVDGRASGYLERGAYQRHIDKDKDKESKLGAVKSTTKLI